jgi:membrane protease YdiL (CAAX protease family)
MRPSLTVVLVGFFLLWLLLDRTAAAFASYRGEAGIAVCLIVLAAAIIAEAAIARRSPAEGVRALGLSAPNMRGLLSTLTLCIALLCFYPLFAAFTDATLSLRADWLLLLPGLFAQAGVAEETVFRGFLFRHLRQGRAFWSAAGLAAIPFAAVHLLLFLTLDFVVALASVLLSLSLSFPLAWLFERSGNSVWPPALVHFTIQGSIKLVETDAGTFASLATIWIVLGALVPWLVFLLRPVPSETG